MIPKALNLTNKLANRYLLCCDWGTSSFRLQLVDTSKLICLGEVHTNKGVADVFAAWQVAVQPMGREEFFRTELRQQIHRLETQQATRLTGVPLVISGMASSSIGLAEVPYAGLPFAVDGSQTSVRWFDSRADFQHDTLLVSGVRSDHDVMRGEETQLIGLMTLPEFPTLAAQQVIGIFPGTHAKHLYIQNWQLFRFDTFMTGELFALLLNHSILGDSTDWSGHPPQTDRELQAFLAGVAKARVQAIPLTQTLFQVRTNQLFGQYDLAENAQFLSGLLIGTELSSLVNSTGKLLLCGGRKLAPFYQLALDYLGLSAHTLVVDADKVDWAASAGQVRLFNRQTIHSNTP